eukprot:47230-Alexandrium_andersonii.AAC.1
MQPDCSPTLSDALHLLRACGATHEAPFCARVGARARVRLLLRGSTTSRPQGGAAVRAAGVASATLNRSVNQLQASSCDGGLT